MPAHMAYFEALGPLSEQSPDWLALSAGLVTIKLVDLLIEGRRPTRDEMRAVESRIAAMAPHDPTTHVLREIIATIAGRGDVAASLLAYGRLLQSASRWALAADVYQTTIDYAQGVRETDAVMQATLVLGLCFRALARFDDAERTYAGLRNIALRARNTRYRLQARLAEARLERDRGHSDIADAILDEVIDRAGRRKEDAVLSKALHERGRIAGERGQYPRAVTLIYQALTLCDDTRNRDRLLIDLALASSKLGRRDMARDAYLVVSVTAQEQDMRWLAVINLMEIAALDGRADAFDQYRRQLEEEPLTPYLAGAYQHSIGHGYLAFGRVDEAAVAFSRLFDLAQRYDMDECARWAGEGMRLLETGRLPSRPAAPHPGREGAKELGKVAEALASLRITAGVADR